MYLICQQKKMIKNYHFFFNTHREQLFACLFLYSLKHDGPSH